MKKFIIPAISILFFGALSIGAIEYYTTRPVFCSSCHIMKKPYNSWEKSEHRNVSCLDCHYAPGEQHSVKAKLKGLAQLFSYFSTREKEVRKRTLIADISCMSSNCHPPEKFLAKKAKFTEKVSFTHKTHEDKTIEGQKLHCNTCHIHLKIDKHFEVPKEACFLCHFKNTAFNEGRSECLLCHELPEEPIQKHGEKPITHKLLKESKVPCGSCHLEIITGKGEIKEESCLECHDSAETLNKAKNKKLMHEQHVAGQNANCFNCHEPIQHKKAEFLDPVIKNCASCHPDHHNYQKLLLAGEKREGVSESPNPMFISRTNCLGCHVETSHDKKGQELKIGSSEACVACHSGNHEKMLKDWIDELQKELKEAMELEKKAEKIIANAIGKISEEKLKKAEKMLETGRSNLRIVQYGNGVHNKKYAMLLLDSAFINFEDLIDDLKR